MRVLITRPREEALETAAALHRAGIESIVAPVLEIQPCVATPGAPPVDAVIATSSQALKHAGHIAERLKGLPLSVVGARTARDARARGWTRIERAARDSVDLARAIVASPSNRSWLYLAGEPRRRELEQTLADSGVRLFTVVVYQTGAAARLSEDATRAARAHQIDAVLHFSPRSAEVFVALVAQAGLTNDLSSALHVAISPRAAEPLRAHWTRIRIADAPNESALLQKLTESDRGAP